MLESLDKNTEAEKAVSKFTATELNRDEGMILLILKLNSIFQIETTDEAYDTYSKIFNFTRQENIDMND